MSDITINRNIDNVAAAIMHSTRYSKKVLVGGFNIEAVRFGKIVHIEMMRRIPKIHNDGRVTIRHHGEDIEIFADAIILSDREDGKPDYTTYRFHI